MAAARHGGGADQPRGKGRPHFFFNQSSVSLCLFAPFLYSFHRQQKVHTQPAVARDPAEHPAGGGKGGAGQGSREPTCAGRKAGGRAAAAVCGDEPVGRAGARGWTRAEAARGEAGATGAGGRPDRRRGQRGDMERPHTSGVGTLGWSVRAKGGIAGRGGVRPAAASQQGAATEVETAGRLEDGRSRRRLKAGSRRWIWRLGTR